MVHNEKLATRVQNEKSAISVKKLISATSVLNQKSASRVQNVKLATSVKNLISATRVQIPK